MATATASTDEDGGAKREDLVKEMSKLRTLKNELLERRRPIEEELRPIEEQLDTIARLERQCVDRLETLTRVTAQRDDSENQPQTIRRLELELDRLKRQNDQLKQALYEEAGYSKAQFNKIAELESIARSETVDSSRLTVTELRKRLNLTAKLLNNTKEELSETRRQLSDVRDRLTVAEQVTEATQLRALQQSGNSEQLQLQLQLAPQQPTTHAG